MFSDEIESLRIVVRLLVDNLRAARHDERGMTTETAIITALLVGLALALMAAIGAVVSRRISEINRG